MSRRALVDGEQAFSSIQRRAARSFIVICRQIDRSWPRVHGQKLILGYSHIYLSGSLPTASSHAYPQNAKRLGVTTLTLQRALGQDNAAILVGPHSPGEKHDGCSPHYISTHFTFNATSIRRTTTATPHISWARLLRASSMPPAWLPPPLTPLMLKAHTPIPFGAHKRGA